MWIDGRPSAVSVDWSRLRCGSCGGNAYADDVRTTRIYPALAWDQLEPPRRGRPPRWLIAEREQLGEADPD